MKALLSSRSAINQSSLIVISALILIAPLVFPGFIARADGLQTDGTNQPLVFKINDFQNQNSLTLQQAAQVDPLSADLQAYLQNYNSPLANYVPQLLTVDNWKQIVAISFVESHMCQYQIYNNCSGIGGQGHLYKYKDLSDWINGMSTLLSAHYSGWTLAEMDGVYVQPYSPNWRYGSERVLAELTVLEQKASDQRAANAQNLVQTATVGYPQLAMLSK